MKTYKKITGKKQKKQENDLIEKERGRDRRRNKERCDDKRRRKLRIDDGSEGRKYKGIHRERSRHRKKKSLNKKTKWRLTAKTRNSSKQQCDGRTLIKKKQKTKEGKAEKKAKILPTILHPI